MNDHAPGFDRNLGYSRRLRCGASANNADYKRHMGHLTSDESARRSDKNGKRLRKNPAAMQNIGPATIEGPNQTRYRRSRRDSSLRELLLSSCFLRKLRCRGSAWLGNRNATLILFVGNAAKAAYSSRISPALFEKGRRQTNGLGNDLTPCRRKSPYMTRGAKPVSAAQQRLASENIGPNSR